MTPPRGLSTCHGYLKVERVVTVQDISENTLNMVELPLLWGVCVFLCPTRKYLSLD